MADHYLLIWVVYESKLGNTAALAQLIAGELAREHRVRLMPAEEAGAGLAGAGVAGVVDGAAGAHAPTSATRKTGSERAIVPTV